MVGLITWLLGCMVLAGPLGSAEVPLRTTNRLQGQVEKMYHIAGARVVKADYGLLIADFPDELRGKSWSFIDQQLIGAGAVISKPQVEQTGEYGYNSPIPIEPGVRVVAKRPHDYGRAVVVTFLSGLLDVKGAGYWVQPMRAQRWHKNGLMTLREALREYLMEKMINLVLKHAGYDPGTLGTYAVLDLGFDVIWEGGHRERAGAVLRRGHRRPNVRPHLLLAVRAQVEAILRRYGITSDIDLQATDVQTLDRNNVQLTLENAVVDFGTPRVLREFRGSPVNPDPAIRIPFESWGTVHDVLNDQPQTFAWSIAERWARGEISRSQINREFAGMLKPIQHRLFPCAGRIADNL